MPDTVSIAAINFLVRPVHDFDEFAQHVRGLLDQAEGADLVLLPELFTVELFTTEPTWRTDDIADLTRIDAYTDDYRALFTEEARRRGQHIAAGSHLMKRGDRHLNVAGLFTPEGTVHEHAKTHIFPGEAAWSTSEGDELKAIDLPFAKVGFAVCYEAEIPEVSSSLAEQGAEIILCPSYTFTEHGFWRVRHCAASRAIENQVYFVHCSTGGSPGAPLPNGWTRSSILGPCDQPWAANGVIAEAGENTETLARGVVDLDALRRNREDGAATTFRDRRRRAGTYAEWPSHIKTA
ncbi:carbon-nitrogen hydrolase family protein [Streptomyces sp. AC04842]|uniref:carbon-nitrogen hydrolase family protein n=1 Tax=Streptomyces TaxID=1883 RepID=UPI001674C522|nr:carbon-nitrogen hydrolase family protein [Streptomyces sp. AC04842]GHE69649.1 hydrolase [Streptomyces cellulosae]